MAEQKAVSNGYELCSSHPLTGELILTFVKKHFVLTFVKRRVILTFVKKHKSTTS